MKLSLWLRTLRMLFAVADDKSKPVETLTKAEAAVRIAEDTVDEIQRDNLNTTNDADAPIGASKPDPRPGADPPPAKDRP